MADLDERLRKYNKNLFFGKWRLDGKSPEEALIGQGLVGRVYSVYREETDPFGRMIRYWAAIKVICVDERNVRLQKCRGMEQRQQALRNELQFVEREIDIMRQLEGERNIAYFQDSRIIRRMDTDLESWDVLICMEKLVGLRQHLRDMKLMPGTYPYNMQVLCIWKEISAALSVCERHSILHTDVKPENVFYAPGPKCYKLSDFGTSIEGKDFGRGIRYGTYAYMSPEMYHARGGDSRSDMYSLAVMIYELFNGNVLPLQKGMDREEAWKARLLESGKILPVANIPEDINAVLLRCLEEDPERRYACCSELQAVIDDLYHKYKEQGTMKQASTRNKRAVIALTLGAAVLAGALGAGMLLLTAGEKPDAQPISEPIPTICIQAEKAEIRFDSEQLMYRPGERVRISGVFRPAGEAAEPGELCLIADGEEWHAALSGDRGEYRFSADVELNRSGDCEVEICIVQQENREVLACGTMRFVEEK